VLAAKKQLALFIVCNALRFETTDAHETY
jgi:hypothetical protein